MATTTTTTAKPAAAGEAPQRRPRPAKRIASSVAALREQRVQMVQLGLFAAGAVLMPLGLIAISLGWYGTAHARYDYDQRTYLISGGVLGLGLILVGGFLYFGAWLAKIATDQRDSARQMTDTLLVLVEVAKRQSERTGVGAGAGTVDGAELVVAGEGTTLHRRDCALIAHREDLRPVRATQTNMTGCRVCRPSPI